MILDTLQQNLWLMTLALGSTFVLAILWMKDLGYIRGGLAVVCRILWVAPIFLALFPQMISKELPRRLHNKIIHVLLDDSESMKPVQKEVQKTLSEAGEECKKFGCVFKEYKLSSLDDRVQKGFTPLSSVLPNWLSAHQDEGWMVLTDGGDFEPSLSWDFKLQSVQGIQGFASASPSHGGPSLAKNGLIVSFQNPQTSNVRLEETHFPPFAFDAKPFSGDVVLKRSRKEFSYELVQVQVMEGEDVLTTANAEFAEGRDTARVTMYLPSLPKGQHLLSIKAIPTAEDMSKWDKQLYVPLEVLPNTVGVLHLLGNPSWDGRFLRRYLKSEPKYDLISFFILRDPWDNLQVDERELSLIPFPVARLFNEELSHFRVIILQDFNLLQFLLPEYQHNLVEFIKKGGGLLFLGGSRALLDSDLRNSPLREILPFTLKEGSPTTGASYPSPFEIMMGGMQEPKTNKSPFSPWYDGALQYSVEFAQPDSHKRALANVFEDWELLSEPLTKWKKGMGMHHMENIKFKDDLITPLLVAKTEDGKKIPLAVASYPEKGRALWIFTDSLWKLALNPQGDLSRDVYNEFMQASMTWLLREDLRKPLVLADLRFHSLRDGGFSWQVFVEGPASRYLDETKFWTFQICDTMQDKVHVEKLGAEKWKLGGQISQIGMSGDRQCSLVVNGEHPAFGSVHGEIRGVLAEAVKDEDIGEASPPLQKLAALTHAQLLEENQNRVNGIKKWLEQQFVHKEELEPPQFKTYREFYWFLDLPFAWLVLLFLPLEIWIRRWEFLGRG